MDRTLKVDSFFIWPSAISLLVRRLPANDVSISIAQSKPSIRDVARDGSRLHRHAARIVRRARAEVKHLRRCDVDLVKRLLQVRRSKNETSHRVIPLNASAIQAAARIFERADLPRHTEPEHYL